ncbi:MAG: K(+)-transporting ATPase subunit F [Kofleriaceae bacterium]
MSVLYVVAAAVSIALAIYLFVALLDPEKLQ